MLLVDIEGLLDHPIGERNQSRGKFASNFLCSLKVKYKLKLRRLLDRQISWLGAFQDLTYDVGRIPKRLLIIGPIGGAAQTKQQVYALSPQAADFLLSRLIKHSELEHIKDRHSSRELPATPPILHKTITAGVRNDRKVVKGNLCFVSFRPRGGTIFAGKMESNPITSAINLTHRGAIGQLSIRVLHGTYL
jgi:hypothetical protein